MRLWRLRLLGVAVLVATGDWVWAGPMGTGFTFQARLKAQGAPVNDVCDFQFGLFDVQVGGTAIGAYPLAVDDVVVTDGVVFIRDMNFGAAAIDGEARWLEVQLQCTNDATFRLLSPRLKLNPAPHAMALPGLRTQQNASGPDLIGGFCGNVVTTGVIGGTIGGGGRVDDGDAWPDNNIVTDDFGTIAGGRGNRAGNDNGGTQDSVAATVGGGWQNTASDHLATVGGGANNTASYLYATVGGGSYNVATGHSAVVAGGWHNSADGSLCTVSGGEGNTASGGYNVVSGGYYNTANMPLAVVGGGEYNIASGMYATVSGGSANQAGGSYSMAGGRQAKVRDAAQSGDWDGDEGTFVWADSNYADFVSTGPNQFLIRAAGGVGIGDASPDAQLDVEKSAAIVAIFNRATDDGTVIEFQQDGIAEGAITISGDTVSYNAFTGSHYGTTNEPMERGMIVTMNGRNRRLHGSAQAEPIYGVVATTTPNDPRCLGAYLGLQEPKKQASDDNPHQIMAIGNGEMWIVDTGRNVLAGDLLISSDVRGHAMLDDDVKFAVGHVVARAAEPIQWDRITDQIEGRKHVRISVLFESFQRGPGELGTLTERNRQLEQRLSTLERAVAELSASKGGGQ